MNLQLSDPMTHYRPTWVDISTDDFVANFQLLRQRVGPHVKILAVVKADAYGHGAIVLTKAAMDQGAYGVGVSSLEEGIALRDSSYLGPLLLLGGLYPLENFSVALDHNFIPTVASLDSAKALNDISRQAKKKALFHLKVDTGMGRIGISPSAIPPFLEWLRTTSSIELAGVYSHFSSADSDTEFSIQQRNEFNKVRAMVTTAGFTSVIFHMANSAALFQESSFHLDMVRPGLSLYGVSPSPMLNISSLHPVLQWKTRVVYWKKVPAKTPISYGRTFVTKKTTEVATLPVGYADGLPRLASNKGSVLVRGKRCPIIGRVTMDHTMVDVTGVGADIGDEAVLIGSQGSECISVTEWADVAQTNSYEIFCGISKRVPRLYGGNYAPR